MTDQEPLTFDEYQRRARQTAIYPREHAVTYPALGLVGEAGEVCEKIKKGIRDHGGRYDHDALIKEIGDTLWYLAALAGDLDIALSRCAPHYAKTFEAYQSRLKETIHGEGSVMVAIHLAHSATTVAVNSINVRDGHLIAVDLHDVLQFAVRLATALGLDFEDIARTNLAKLADRARRGSLQGEGDGR